MHRNSCMWASGKHSDTGSLAFDSLSPVFLQAATFRRFDDVFGWFFNWINWRSGIFLLLVYLTYWPSKCAICCVLYDANFHKVWSWYDRPLPSPSICAAMSRDLMTSTFYLGHTYRSCDQPLYQIWRSYDYPFMSYELWRLPLDTTEDSFAATAYVPYHVTSA